MRIPPIRRLMPALAAAILLSLASAGCESTSQLAPTPEAPQSAIIQSQAGVEYTLLEDRIPSEILDLDVSKLIGLSGGQISLAGHTLTVPAGAVSVPTVFTLTLRTTGYIDVDASALVTSLLGKVINVGEKGFNKPVKLTLSYARSPNAPADPSGITVLRMLGSSHADPHQPLSTTVDAQAKTATAYLDHFSGYCLADN